MVAQQLTVAPSASASDEAALLLELLASGLTLPEFLETLGAPPPHRGRAEGHPVREPADPAPRRTTHHRAAAPASHTPQAAPRSTDPAHWYRATAPLWDAIDRAWPAGAEQAA